MFNAKVRNLVTAAVPLLLIASSAWAQSDRDFHWTGKLSPDNAVEIKGVNGAIEAEAGSGDEVEVTAEKSGPDADDVKIVAVPSGEGITICAIYPRSGRNVRRVRHGKSTMCAETARAYTSTSACRRTCAFRDTTLTGMWSLRISVELCTPAL